MDTNTKKSRKSSVRGMLTWTVRGRVIFTGLILCGLLSGPAGTARADENHAVSRDAAKEQKQTGATAPQKAGSREAETIVARVNGVPITKGSLDRMVDQIQLENPSRETGNAEKTPEGEVRKKALDRLIFQELVYQKAKQEGVSITEQELADTIKEVKEKAGGEEAYGNYLKGISKTEDEMKAAVERSLIIGRYYTKELTDKTPISEDTLKAEYERNKDKFVVPESITATDVVFFLDINDSASFKKAEEIRAKIASAPDKNSWTLEPDGTFIVREILIKKEPDIELYNEAKKLAEGELSPVFKTKDSLHILQLKKYVPETQVPFERVKPYIEQKLRAAARQEKAKRWEQELKKGAVIEIMPEKK